MLAPPEAAPPDAPEAPLAREDLELDPEVPPDADVAEEAEDTSGSMVTNDPGRRVPGAPPKKARTPQKMVDKESFGIPSVIKAEMLSCMAPLHEVEKV